MKFGALGAAAASALREPSGRSICNCRTSIRGLVGPRRGHGQGLGKLRQNVAGLILSHLRRITSIR